MSNSSLALILAQLSKDPFTSLFGHPTSPLLLKRCFDTLVRRSYLEELTSCITSILTFHNLPRLSRDILRHFIEVWRNIKCRILTILFLNLIYNGLAEDDFVFVG